VTGLVALRVVSVGGLKCVNEGPQWSLEPFWLTPSIALREEGLVASLLTANLEGVSALPECILSP